MSDAAPQLEQYAALLTAFEAAVGQQNVLTDDASLTYFSQDYYRSGVAPIAVIRPPTVEALAQATGLATSHGVAVFPRGGGFSYTDAYLPNRPDSIIVDTQLLNKIVEINTDDMYVTVEAGCTWAALEEALADTAVRSGFWGTLSGYNATIGGTVSQGGASLGSAKYGMSSESVLALEVVSADGTIVRTGSAGQHDKTPFFRNYGPDVTGLFCCDAGALGIKARVTLRLERRRRLHYGLSFGFESFDDMLAGMAAVAAEGRATEHLSFSAETMANFGELSFKETLKTAFAVAKVSSNWFSGLIQVAKMGLAGRRFLNSARYMSHCVVEAANQKELAGQIQRIREVVAPHGRDLPNTVPTVIRAAPFMQLDTLSPKGQRGLPIHTVLPFSKVMNFHHQFNQYVAGMEAEMAAHGVSIQSMFTTLGTTGFLYEPVFYWCDEPNSFHKRHTQAEVLAKAEANPNSAEATALVEKMRVAIVHLMHQCGGIHLQIGKAYPFMKDRDAASSALINAIKAELDPKGLINPAALELPQTAAQ